MAIEDARPDSNVHRCNAIIILYQYIMPLTYRSLGNRYQISSYSNLIPTPITNVAATSTVAGQIVVTWSGGAGYKPIYTYSVYNNTGSAIVSPSAYTISGTNPTTLTLTDTTSNSYTVTVTSNVLDGSGNGLSNAITSQSPGVILSKASLNLQNWYNPDNVTVTGGYVTSWSDSMGNYNLTNVASGGTGNTMTKTVASGTTSNVIYQSTVSATGNYSYLYGSTFSETIYSVMFCCNTLLTNGGFDEIFGDLTKVGSIRFTVSPNVPRSLNNGDLNYAGSTFINGVNVQGAINSAQYPLTVPTGYTIYCFYITGSMRTVITQLCILGDYASNNRSFNGYAGDFFVGNASFGTTEQQLLEGYLGYKYKCQSLLPTNHPYYSATNNNIVLLS